MHMHTSASTYTMWCGNDFFPRKNFTIFGTRLMLFYARTIWGRRDDDDINNYNVQAVIHNNILV